MAEADGGGQPVQILKMKGSKLELDVRALGLILLADHLKDKPVVVVSVAGAFRKGKSFLLNFFLRYLRNLDRDDVDWLGQSEAPLRGFSWCNGSEPHTTGILVWSEVFLVTTSEGQELAVVLMDTQGTFDCETTTGVYSAIFALSTMVSSVLIYNISQNIQEDDLQHLQIFVDYGQMVLEESQQQPFQKLLFLVRDWACPYQEAYGAEGGQKLMEKRLRMTAEQDAGLRQLRQRINSCFATIGCYLMPYPGTTVATSEFFDGRLSDIDKVFKMHLRQLVALVLAPNNLLAKEINGRKITCHELMAYFKAYMRAFKKGGKARSAYEATLRANSLAVKSEAKALYIDGIMKAWKTRDSEDRERMKGHHRRLLEEAKQLFEATPKMGGQEYSRRYMNKLTKEIGELFDDLSEVIGKKKGIFDTVAFNAAHAVVTTGIAGAAVGLAVVELPAIATACAAIGVASLTGYIYNTVKVYKRKQKRKEEGNEALLSAAAEDSDSSLTSQASWIHETTESARTNPGHAAEPHLTTSTATDEDKALAEAGNLSALARAKQMYNVSMEQLCDDASPRLSRHLLESHHYRLRKTAQELFSSTCSAAGVEVLPHFIEALSKEIDELYENFVNQNRGK